MKLEQLSVLDLPPENVLGTLPRFSINGKDAEVIAEFAKAIGEIRLDQVEAEPAGNGKNNKQLQPNLPITIKTSATDAIAKDIKVKYEFKVGDRIKFRQGYRSTWDAEYTTGTITEDIGHSYRVVWDNYEFDHIYYKDHIHRSKWWQKCHDTEFLENSNDANNFPEISTKPKTQGYVEDYLVIGKNKKVYFYTRYVYSDISGKLRHHHISQKQTEAIKALWHSGASAKEIVTALGKIYKSE